MVKLLERCYGISGLIYILDQERKHKADKVMETLTRVIPHQKKIVMTAAQQLREKGREEGREEEKMNIAKNMLSKLRLNLQTVAQITGIDLKTLLRLQEQEVERK
mmetsp:Transcript_10204/g.23633  ORF Transcript_10204/g.23633 Transcript_10204/m.23633 type:complete len:105 (-) Transcript_10204:4096-4410(-)